MSVTITRDEWLSEFERLLHATRPGDPGLSTDEIADALGIGMHRVNKMMREAFKQGRVVVGRKPGMALDGRRCMIPCYQLKPARLVTEGRGDTHQKAAKRR